MRKSLPFMILLLALYSWSITQAMKTVKEVMDLSPELIIDTTIALSYLCSEHYQESTPTLGENPTSNLLLVCPVRKAGLTCFCRTGYYKTPVSYLAHLNCLTGIYRCLHCKKLYSSSSSLKHHKCVAQIPDNVAKLETKTETHSS